MSEFLRLLPPDEARALWLSAMDAGLRRVESLGTAGALHRVSAEDILAPHPLPEFPRSTVDGYALRARDTFGASSSLPAYVSLAGEIPMGTAPGLILSGSQCALIHTGGMLPSGADAVVMLENTQATRLGGVTDEVEVLKAVAPGENVISIGEDVKAGQLVVPSGTRLRPQEIGGLMALGLISVRVAEAPRVGIISSGDELVDPASKPVGGQVRDVNAYTLSALVSDVGGSPVRLGAVADDAGQLEAIARKALTTCDMVVITAGSSASTRDLTADAIASLGPPGVMAHGISIKPGKPTILGVSDGKAVIGLPGNPVSALLIARLFLVPAIRKWLGEPEYQPRGAITARLSASLPSQAGREDWWPVRLHKTSLDSKEWVAEPIFGRSNLIFNLVEASGLVRIPPEKNGVGVGETVEVEPF